MTRQASKTSVWRARVGNGEDPTQVARELGMTDAHLRLERSRLEAQRRANMSSTELRLETARAVAADASQPGATRLRAADEIPRLERELAREQLMKQQQSEPARTSRLGCDLQAAFDQQLRAAALLPARGAPEPAPRIEVAGSSNDSFAEAQKKFDPDRAPASEDTNVSQTSSCRHAAHDPGIDSDEQLLAKLPIDQLREIARADFNAALVSTNSADAARELLSLHRGVTAPLPLDPSVIEREQHLARVRELADAERRRPVRFHPEDRPIKGAAKWSVV